MQSDNAGAAGAAADDDLPSWQWPEERWRSAVERVRAGRSLRPTSWPGGAEVAVALSFDSDHETPALRDGIVQAGRLSQGEYGARVGVPRILDLLDHYRMPATFFMPAVSALLHPGEAAGYVQRGHEVAVHGWIHERNAHLEAEAERDLTARSLDVLEQQTGERPVGIRTPSWDFSPYTLDIIAELGFRYDSSLMGDDEPYELRLRGEDSGIVEIPVEWIRDDAPYLTMERFAGVRPHTPPRDLGRIWLDEFELARRERGLFQLTCHPHVIGHRSRIVVLEELLARIAEAPVWVATHRDIADYVAQRNES